MFFSWLPRSHNTPDMLYLEERQRRNHFSEYILGECSLEEVTSDLNHSSTKDIFTRNKCIAAIVIGAALCIACFVISIVIWLQPQGSNLIYKVDISTSNVDWGIEAILLVINFGITLILEALSYVHAVSLRWALYREGRLEFNTNLRLFTAARETPQNRWHTNGLSTVCLILSYASTSLLFVKNIPNAFYVWYENQPSEDFNSTRAYTNSVALFSLGIGLLGHVCIAAWCMWPNTGHIPTWSNSPLINTMVMLKHTIQHQPNRCMMSVEDQSIEDQPTKPRTHQPSFNKKSKIPCRLVIFVWIIVVLAAAWSVAMTLVSRKYSIGGGGLGSRWKFTDTFEWKSSFYKNINTYIIPMNPALYSTLPPITIGWQLFCATLFLCLVQGLQTLGLHCSELLMSVARDEKVWRKTYVHSSLPKTGRSLMQKKEKGIDMKRSSISSALHSWEYIILFTFKPALHWIMGQSFSLMVSNAGPGTGYDDIGPHGGLQFAFVYPRLIIYTMLSVVLAIFTTYLAFRKPKGPQPVTWGHIQTLADLIDDWRLDENGCLWWGDKGIDGQGIRHAGTSADRESLGRIEMDAFYAGEYDGHDESLIKNL